LRKKPDEAASGASATGVTEPPKKLGKFFRNAFTSADVDVKVVLRPAEDAEEL
jgi:hypothetical protein